MIFHTLSWKVCPEACGKWQVTTIPRWMIPNHRRVSNELHSHCMEIKFQNALCSVTPHTHPLPLPVPFPLQATPTSLQDTWRAIASQHIPGSLTQRAMAEQFAFNKQLNRNKKPLREEHSKSASERDERRERVRTMQFGKNAVTLIYLTITTKRRFYNYCACKHALLLQLARERGSTRECEWERERAISSASKGNARRNVKVKWQLQQKPHRDGAQRQTEEQKPYRESPGAVFCLK